MEKTIAEVLAELQAAVLALEGDKQAVLNLESEIAILQVMKTQKEATYILNGAEARRLLSLVQMYLQVAPAPTPSPLPGPAPTPSPPPPPPPVAEGWVSFVPIDGVIYPDTFTENRWGRQFGVSNWAEGKFANGPWQYDHVVKNNDGTVTLKANPRGNGQLQHHTGYFGDGRVGAVVQIANIRPDAIVAPLWLYSNYAQGNDGSGRFEFDFEIAGRRALQINYHDGIKPGKNVLEIPGDFSNRTIRFEIDYSQLGGFADFYVDGVMVKRLTRLEVEGTHGMKWPIRGLFPLYDLWLVNNPGWTGAPYNPNDTTTMEVRLLERLYNKRS